MTQRAIVTPEQEVKSNKAIEARRAWLLEAWRWVLSDTRGRVALQMLVELAPEMNDNNFTTNGSEMYFRSGKRAVIARLLETVKEVNIQMPAIMETEFNAGPRIKSNED